MYITLAHGGNLCFSRNYIFDFPGKILAFRPIAEWKIPARYFFTVGMNINPVRVMEKIVAAVADIDFNSYFSPFYCELGRLDGNGGFIGKGCSCENK